MTVRTSFKGTRMESPFIQDCNRLGPNRAALDTSMHVVQVERHRRTRTIPHAINGVVHLRLIVIYLK